MYEDAFETKFLKATEALYHEEGNRYMQETDVSYHFFQYMYLYSGGRINPSNTGLKISFNSSWPLRQPALKFYLPWASL